MSYQLTEKDIRAIQNLARTCVAEGIVIYETTVRDDIDLLMLAKDLEVLLVEDSKTTRHKKVAETINKRCESGD